MTDDPAPLYMRGGMANTQPGSASATNDPPNKSTWAEIDPGKAAWLVLAAHVMGLRRSEVLEDAAFVAIARALDAAGLAAGNISMNPNQLVVELGNRVESLLPGHLSGAATLGLAREEWLATASRILLRGAALATLNQLIDVSGQAVALAETHAVTVMPAFLGGRPAQPTTLAHYLGGLIGPLGSSRERVVEAFPQLNRSALGAGILAGDVIAADREELADRLGFLGPVPNTLDALMGVEDVVAMAEAALSGISPIRRFVKDILVWIRTDPASFVLHEEWFSAPEPAHPTLIRSERLEALQASLVDAEDTLHRYVHLLRESPYGPLGSAVALLFDLHAVYQGTVGPVLSESSRLITTGLIVNRAYLGNRAGRSYSTAGDLAAFLMTEEQLSPASARDISALVLSQLQKSGQEVSSITQDMIDSAAMLIIGREIKVEIESLGRFLAPRRFLERRQVTGSPAPAMTRAWLAEERDLLERHREWVRSRKDEVSFRIRSLKSVISEAAAEPDA